mmetsp:Transcript_31050/g.66086  ORF Transcript_31050/g.66086 Transcript_31050/m.66086 type:complete len:223 (+) Transcript_31050:885-1553(+)
MPPLLHPQGGSGVGGTASRLAQAPHGRVQRQAIAESSRTEEEAEAPQRPLLHGGVLPDGRHGAVLLGREHSVLPEERGERRAGVHYRDAHQRRVSQAGGERAGEVLRGQAVLKIGVGHDEGEREEADLREQLPLLVLRRWHELRHRSGLEGSVGRRHRVRGEAVVLHGGQQALPRGRHWLGKGQVQAGPQTGERTRVHCWVPERTHQMHQLAPPAIVFARRK